MLLMSQRIPSLFGIRYPLVQAGMIWCSGWRLTAAVSEAGGLGLIGAGSMNPDLLREHIRKCKAATDKPFGVNLPLLYSNIQEQMEVVMEEGVKIAFTSAGNPAKWTPVLKDKGMTVVHVIANVKSAIKAMQSGVDALVAEGFEAGGHNGKEETTTLVLIPMIRQVTDLPIIAAGGIATGRAMAAVMILGADGVQIGTRFVASDESSAHPAFKQAVISAADGDTLLAMKSLVAVRLLRNEFFRKVHEMERSGASAEVLQELLGKGRAKLGMFEGDLINGELEIGQASALIREILPAGKIVEEIISEWKNITG
jgi:enoyl-[acyl-carrier protein] reductase II